MSTILPKDKSSFQGRRFLGSKNIITQNAVEKKSTGKRFLRLKNPFSKKKPFQHPFFQSKKRVMITSVALLILVIVGGAFSFYEYALSQDPAVIYAKKLKSMTQVVSQQVTLPKDEQPVVATVSDISKLPKEAFFKNAQDGDKILMYKKDKKAILYRPSTGQVVTVAVLDFQNIKPTPAQRSEVAGASTSANLTSTPASSAAQYVPQGKILVEPQQ